MLEDASGFQGEADRLFAPASEAELLEIDRGASRAAHPSPLPARAPDSPAAACRKAAGRSRSKNSGVWKSARGRAIAGAGRLARSAASRGRAHRPVLCARSHRAHRQHRRHHRHQRQRIAQLPLRQHAPAYSWAASGADGWPRAPPSGAATRSISRFPNSAAQHHQEHGRISAGARNGLDRSVHRQRRHARNRHRSRTATAARTRRCPGGRRVPDQRRRGSGRRGRLAAHPGPADDRVLRSQLARFSAAALSRDSRRAPRLRCSSSRKTAISISGPIMRLKTAGSPPATRIASASAASATRCRNW